MTNEQRELAIGLERDIVITRRGRIDILTTGLAHCMAVAIYPRDRSRSGAALSHVSGGGVRKTPTKSTQHDFFTEATIATVRLAADKFQTAGTR